MPRLRRSSPDANGFSRRKSGRGFVYLDDKGSRIADQEALRRIKALAIPPAWVEVWICPYPNGHIQALGTDDAGRRQYLYHARWHEERSLSKFERSLNLGFQLPRLRRRLKRQIHATGLGRGRVLACAVRLLDLGAFRIGNEEYARRNSTFGLATLRRDHVHLAGARVTFDFPAKSGQPGQATITDPGIRAVIRDLLRRRDGSPELLASWDRSTRRWADVKSTDINDYLRKLTDRTHTAKDFRTWHGSVLMAMNLAERSASHEVLTRRAISEAFRAVSEELGNTPAVVRNSYVDPRVIDFAERGHTIRHIRRAQHELVPASASTALYELLSTGPSEER